MTSSAARAAAEASARERHSRCYRPMQASIAEKYVSIGSIVHEESDVNVTRATRQKSVAMHKPISVPISGRLVHVC